MCCYSAAYVPLIRTVLVLLCQLVYLQHRLHGGAENDGHENDGPNCSA